MRKRVGIVLEESVLEKADAMASSLGLSRSAYISFLISAVDQVTAGTAGANNQAQSLVDQLVDTSSLVLDGAEK